MGGEKREQNCEWMSTFKSSVSVDIFWMLSFTSAMSKEELLREESVCTLLFVSLFFVWEPASFLTAVVWESFDVLSLDFDVCVCLACCSGK